MRGRGRRRIQGGIYCCYDAFSGLDLRCELTVPGRGLRTFTLTDASHPSFFWSNVLLPHFQTSSHVESMSE